MKYYIVGKKMKEGIIGNDGMGKLSEYFELGWEYVATHLTIKHMFVENRLEKDDVIVTLKDRMFLYTGFWSNVMSFEDFTKKNIKKNVIDLCDQVDRTPEKFLPKVVNGKYEYWDSDINVIKNVGYVDITHLPIDKPYCCLHLRYREWANFRNLSKDNWRRIINKIKLSGIKIFIFGKGTEEFADGETVLHTNLDEYASLLNNKNCKFLIGTMSGGTLIAQTCSHKNCVNNVIITDKQTLKEFNTKNNYQVFYHSQPFNFSETNINFIKMEELNNFIEKL
jgi:ADP-heptose:LPS heptosyltransferase